MIASTSSPAWMPALRRRPAAVDGGDQHSTVIVVLNRDAKPATLDRSFGQQVAGPPGLTVSLGIAKPIPTEAPVGETMTELTPITWPSMLNTGPPEFPGLIGASSCRKLSNGPDPRSRPSAEMMPAVTEPPSPNGLPAARIQSPTSIRRESPQVTADERLVGHDLDHGDIGQRVLADQFRRILMSIGQRNDDLFGAADDVVVGHDDAGGIDDEAGTSAQCALLTAEPSAELAAQAGCRAVPEAVRASSRALAPPR